MAINPKVGLTDRQQKFCHEFMLDFNGTAAAIRAGYSRKGAAATASRLLTNDKIQAYLSRLRDRTSRNAEVTLERTLEEISYVAFSRFTDAASFDNEGLTLKDSSGLPESVLAAIESVTFTETTTEWGVSKKKALKVHSKMAALGFLADYFGIRDDFNKARATLKRYGLALIQDDDCDLGWRLERYVSASADATD